MLGMMTMRIVLCYVNGNGRPLLDPDRNIEKNNRRLEDRHPDQLLDQIVLRDHGVETDEQQHYVYAVVEPLDKQFIQ